MTTCGKCASEWQGKRAEHCVDGCHETFASAEPGDSHRVGDHTVGDSHRVGDTPLPRGRTGDAAALRPR